MNYKRRLLYCDTSKSLTHEIDLDGSSQDGKTHKVETETEVDTISFISVNDLPCLYANMSPVPICMLCATREPACMTLNYLSVYDPYMNRSSAHSPQNELLKRNYEIRTQLKPKKPLKRKMLEENLDKSSYRRKKS